MNCRTYRQWQRKHPNFVTPTIKCLTILKNGYIIELSEGSDFNHNPFYGVTLLCYKGKKIYTCISEDRNRCGGNKTAIDKYYKELIEIINKWPVV